MNDFPSSQNTRIVEKDGVVFLEYPILDGLPVTCASSTRIGGVTDDPFLGSMNLGLSVSDSRENIRENYRRFCRAAGFDAVKVVPASQFHNDLIKTALPEDGGKGVFKELDYQDKDGLITNQKGLALTVFGADCVPVLFADRKGRGVGACHCGWKGTYKGLAPKTAAALRDAFGCGYSDLFAVIGPCIHSCCYGVSPSLAEDFARRFSHIPGEWLIRREGETMLDLPELNRRQLLAAGLSEEHILVCDLCTSCHKDFLFSHRASGGKRGLLANMIALK